jgi:hypothetical protein
MVTQGLLSYNNKICDNQLDWDNKYRISVCVFHSPFKIFSTMRALCFLEAVNRRQPYHKCKAETHIKYCHSADVWWRRQNHPRFAEWHWNRGHLFDRPGLTRVMPQEALEYLFQEFLSRRPTKRWFGSPGKFRAGSKWLKHFLKHCPG